MRVYMECDYTCLNHNSLMSQKQMVTKGMIIKGVCSIKFECSSSIQTTCNQYLLMQYINEWMIHCFVYNKTFFKKPSSIL